MDSALDCFRRISRTILFLSLLAEPTMTALHAEEVPLESLQTRMAGLYTLEEWHKDGAVFRSPQVNGRFVILNGTIMTILDNRMQPSIRVTTVVIGRYELDPTRFSYAYDEVSEITEEGDTAKVSHKSRWDGMRTFTPSMDGDALRLRQTDGPFEFVFTSEGLDYRSDGKTVRKWRRTSDR